MATEVIMPALGVSQETGRVLRWLKAAGEEVASGEPLLEIETDKVTVELEAPATGVLSSIGAREGEDVPVGRVIGLILAPGEAPPIAPAEAPSDVARAEAPSDVAPSQQARGGRLPASPLARRRAREAGIDLEGVRGSGPGGAVTVADLDAATTSGKRLPAPPTSEPPDVGPVWRRMVEHVTASWTSAPHFYLSRDVDAERLVAWRATIGDDATLTDLLVWLAARALERHPEANSRWDGDAPRRIAQINVGIAVAVDDGLIVPVVHDANRLEVREIADRRRDLVARARSSALRPEDVQGGTFTLSNLGMFGVDAFAAVVNGPQAAILAIGRVADRVVAVEGRPAVRPRMSLTLSCDHRVLDGVRAARFLETLSDVMEEPMQLVT